MEKRSAVSLSRIEEMAEKIKNNLEYYERFKYEDKRYELFLADGSFLKVTYPVESIPHLLGVNVTYAISTGLFNKQKGCFGILKEMCENPYQLYCKIRDGYLSYKDLFSSFFDEKNDAFKDLLYQSIYNISFVCNYDNRKTFYDSACAETSDYFVFKEKQNGDMLVLGLVKKNGAYVPRTSILIDKTELKSEKMQRLLRNQNITFLNRLNSINEYDELKKDLCYDKLRLAKLDLLNNYAADFGCTISVARDYYFQLKRIRNNYEMDKVIKIISELVSNGRIIDEKSLGVTFETLSESIICLIGSYNDLISGGIVIEQRPYTELQGENSRLNDEVAALKADNERMNDLISGLEARNSQLLEENTKYQDANEKIRGIINTL